MNLLPSLATPLVIAIDIQREYITPGRPFRLNGIEPALENCRRVLEHAREERWPIAHTRHLQDSHLFNADTEYSRFIEGFEPLPHEMVFVKNMLSCFSSPEFAKMMETAKRHPIYVIGFNAQMCCLSTLVDGFHRGHRMSLVADATWARSTALGDERESYPWIKQILAVYADIVDTEEVLAIGGRQTMYAGLER